MDNVYEIKLDYFNEPDISKVFETLHEFTSALNSYNNMLTSFVSDEIVTTSALVEIEKGSIKTKVQDLVKRLPNDAQIEHYVDNPKDAIKGLLKEARKTLFKLADLNVSQEEKENMLFEETSSIIENSELSNFGYKVKKDVLFKNADDVYKPLKNTNNKLTVKVDNVKYTLNDCFNYDIEKTFSNNVKVNRFRRNLQIKKPALIGTAKWEFIYEKAIDAEILDKRWLKKLQNREFGILAGDMLDCEIESKIILNDDNEIIEAHYYILEVYDVIYPEDEQKTLY